MPQYGLYRANGSFIDTQFANDHADALNKHLDGYGTTEESTGVFGRVGYFAPDEIVAVVQNNALNTQGTTKILRVQKVTPTPPPRQYEAVEVV